MNYKGLANKHILITANTAWCVHNFRLAVVQGLLDAGCRVTLLAPQDKYRDVLKGIGCECIDIEMDRNGLSPVGDIKFLFALKNSFRTIQPDAIISYTIKNNIYGAIAARQKSIPFIAMVPGLGNAFATGNWLQKVASLLYKFAFKKVHKVLFLNHENRAVFLRRGLIDQDRSMVMVGEGVNLSQFAFQEMPSGEEPRVFLFCARLLYDKGVGDFVAAAKTIRTQYPSTRFQIVGKLAQSHPQGVSQKALDEWIADGDIDYLGETNDVRPYISSAHCVVLPSYYKEGMSRILMESAAIGRPIITTDQPGCRETVVNQETGFLCEPQNVDDLCDCINRVIKLPAADLREMSSKARKLAVKQFDERDRVTTYLEMLNELFES
jgi:glycosyltransferase involved in cell wall biosynthesis